MIKKAFSFSSEIKKMLTKFISANFVLVIGQGISGLIVARLVDPEDMGIFVTSTVILTYIPILLLGINNGLNRNLPFVIGQGRLEEADQLRNTAVSWAIFTSGIILLIVLAISFYFFWIDNEKLALAFLSTSITAALFPIISVKEVTYRTSDDFVKLSKIKLIYIGLIIPTLLLVYFFDFKGMLFRAALIPVFYAILLFLFSDHKYKLNVKKSALLSLLKTGAPIAGIAYLYAIYLGLDKIFIIKYFDTETMGLYVPAIHIGTALAIVPTSIFQIVYPRMALKYGQTGEVKSLKKLAFTPLLYLAIGLIPIFGMAAWLIGPFVEMVLPKYIEGIPTARWMVLVFYFRSLGGPQDVLTVIGDLKPFGIFTILCGFIFFGGFLLLKNMGWNLEAIPISLAFSIFIFNAMIAIYVLSLMRKETIRT